MKTFSMKLDLHRSKKQGEKLSAEMTDADCLKVNAAGFSLVAARTPEVSYFKLFNESLDSNLLLVLGHARYNGKCVLTDETAQSFLQAWERNRKAALNQLDGAFLIIIHEAESGETSLISDPCGTRPVWYAETDKGIYFSTDPRHAAVQAGLSIEPDPAWLWSMLHYRRTVGERSSIKGVRGIPSGSIICWDGQKTFSETWFNYTFAPDDGKSPAAFGNEFLQLVKSTITHTCNESTNPALLLSGGLDSRLLAAVCPKHVECLTLCDSINREVVLAQQVAKTAGLSHRVMMRPENWYPDLLEDSCSLSGGIWLWDQAHFLPLKKNGFNHDATLVGYGSDTFFKGKDIDWDPLWISRHNASKEEIISQCLELLISQPPLVKNGTQLLDTDYAEICQKEFTEECCRELADTVNYCSTLPDAWQLFWNRNLGRAAAFLNLVSLRGFTRESNVFTPVSMRRFYQTLPAELRRSGQLPILALRAGGYRDLLKIADANTWLPYTYPSSLHRLSANARRSIAKFRKQRRTNARNANFKSNCSWPHNGRFWLSSDSMSNLMDAFIAGDVYNRDRYNHLRVEQIWEEHIKGEDDHSNALDFLVTYGCVFSEDGGDA